MDKKIVEITEHITVDSATINLLKAFEKAGFKHAALRGGAIRDYYLLKPELIRDFDIVVNPENLNPRLKGDYSDAKVERLLNEPGESFGCFIAEDWENFEIHDYKESNACVELQTIFNCREKGYKDYYGRPYSHYIDMNVLTYKHPDFIKNVIYGSDAPINAAVMESNGRVWVHPDFVEHAEKLIYKPFRESEGDPSESYAYRKLRNKYEDLKLAA